MWCVMETIVGLDSGQLHHRATIHVTPINIPLEYPCQSHSSPSHPQAREAAGWQFLWLSLSHNFTSYPDWWGHSTSDTSHSFRAAQNRTDVRKIQGVPKKFPFLLAELPHQSEFSQKGRFRPVLSNWGRKQTDFSWKGRDFNKSIILLMQFSLQVSSFLWIISTKTNNPIVCLKIPKILTFMSSLEFLVLHC